MQKKQIIFFGTDEFSAPSLKALLDVEFCEVVAVVTKPDTVRSRGRKIESPEVANIAKENNIKLFQPEKLGEIKSGLQEINADAGVLVAYGKIVPQSIIDLFPQGIINFHPSLLPKLRGPSPIESAILNGDTETGLTLMKLVKEMDAGPILYQEKIKLNRDEDAVNLRDRFSKRGTELFIQQLPDILSGKTKEIPQNDADATYCRLFTKADGDIDPKTMTAADCEHHVRAFLGWPRTRLNFMGNDVIVTRVKVLPMQPGNDWPDIIACAENTFLQIVELVNPKSGKTMKTADYLRGLK
jgi:methionyl-tRNA formyltransferase